MANTLKAGTLASFGGSMAEAMDLALNQALIAEGKPALDMSNSNEARDRRTLFVAIAQGLVDHLMANQEAFDVTADDGVTELGNHRIVIRRLAGD